MENLNAEQIKADLEKWAKNFDGKVLNFVTLGNALAIITSQAQKIKELTEENERLRAENEALAISEVKECEISQMLVYRIRNKHPAVMAVKSDTVLKMQERFNEVFDGMDATQALLRRTFDHIVKEMLEGEK